jgi:hypothetical protein
MKYCNHQTGCELYERAEDIDKHFLHALTQFCKTMKKEQLLGDNYKYFKIFITGAKMTHRTSDFPLFSGNKLLGLR